MNRTEMKIRQTNGKINRQTNGRERCSDGFDTIISVAEVAKRTPFWF